MEEKRVGFPVFRGLLIWVLALFMLPSTQGFADDRPNIVIFVADDLGYADPGYRGSEIETPTIDSLAKDGLVLERFYTAPICSPTRAALLTGRDPMRLGLWLRESLLGQEN